MKLGVNLDHIAVLREARRVNDPNLLMACFEANLAGANQITLHLREDRRHSDDEDIKNAIIHSNLPINLECSTSEDIINLALNLKPFRATIVPEKRQELTTEGGLNLKNKNLKNCIKKLQDKEIEVSLFIDPSKENIDLALELGANWIELHTGEYANISLMLNSNLSYTKYKIKELDKSRKELKDMLNGELIRLSEVASYANRFNLLVAAGHGLNYQNVSEIVKIKDIIELNIGQSIVARSVFVGLKNAIKEMRELIR